LFGLRLRLGDVELRLPTDLELGDLVDLAVEGVHDEGLTPFDSDWTRADPVVLRRNLLQHNWQIRGAWKPEGWKLNLGVFERGALAGCQQISAERFPIRRQVATFSWLGRRFQGRGIGTAMRIAVLALAFDGLGAAVALTSANEDSVASLRVTGKLGYEPNGWDIRDRDGQPVVVRHFLMTSARWRSIPRPAVATDGLEGCRELFG
jgi:RimJ/RimL family protein N-acetyltransferase